MKDSLVFKIAVIVIIIGVIVGIVLMSAALTMFFVTEASVWVVIYALSFLLTVISANFFVRSIE